LLLKELWHRRFNAGLSLVAVVATVALFVAFLSSATAAKRETVRVTRDLGFNLRIIPKQTDMDRFWMTGYSEQTMPEDTLERFARYDRVFLSYNHLVATLQQRYSLAGKDVILTGLAPAITAPEQRHRPMGYAIKPGTLILGYQVAQRLGLKAGAELELKGRAFKIAQCLVESGADEDVRVYGALADVQQVLGLPARINEIKAIDCLCLTADQDPLKILRAELEKALPEAKVLQMRTLADSRAKQRQTADRYFGFMSPLLVLVCAAWVGVLAWLNVRERQAEIGILRALGQGSGRIAGLFLGRALVVGLAGAVAGWTLGTCLALRFGPEVFKVTAKLIVAEPALLLASLVAAPGLAALASFIPAMLAVTMDPADTLRELP
jgi:ABC-type lipoprotein release transport system permease subunit